MFKIHSVDNSLSRGIEYMPASAIVPKAGMPLYMNAGVLTVAGGTNKPTYICLCERDTALAAGDMIPVLRVDGAIVFETTNSASLASVKLGAKVTLSADGTQVTATTENGIAEIIYKEGDAAGSTVRVRFS